MIAIIITIMVLGAIAIGCLAIAAVPVLYIISFVKDKQYTQTVKDNLTQARIDKIRVDQEMVLEGRLPKIASEVALLELKIDKMRRDQGLDNPFNPDNYK